MQTARSSAKIEQRLDDAAAACERRGTQFTAQRRAIFGLILQANKPVTAYELLDQMRPTHKAATPATIYRALEFLLANDLIHKVESLSAFVPCIDADHHDHAAQFYICRQCGAVAERDDHAVVHALEAAARSIGFQPETIIVEVTGLCAKCAAA
jgi:Fur family zinc uptake transcriptional regulator